MLTQVPLHPLQFQVNKVWLLFRLIDQPIPTEQNGDINSFAIIDAASCKILCNKLERAHALTLSELGFQEMLHSAWALRQQFPERLFVPEGEFPAHVTAEAQRHGIQVEFFPENELSAFISETRQFFRERLGLSPVANGGNPEPVKITMGFRMWFVLFVGDPFTPERAMEKLRAMPNRMEAQDILRRVKRNSIFADDFRGLKL